MLSATGRASSTLNILGIEGELTETRQRQAELNKQWDNEKGILKALSENRLSIEQYRREADEAERRGDYGKVAELRYGKIAQANAEIARLEKMKADNPSPIMNESVTDEDIAEVVAKWTGIPVNKMLESED